MPTPAHTLQLQCTISFATCIERLHTHALTCKIVPPEIILHFILYNLLTANYIYVNTRLLLGIYFKDHHSLPNIRNMMSVEAS